jgi:hypothetical protein
MAFHPNCREFCRRRKESVHRRCSESEVHIGVLDSRDMEEKNYGAKKDNRTDDNDRKVMGEVWHSRKCFFPQIVVIRNCV